MEFSTNTNLEAHDQLLSPLCPLQLSSFANLQMLVEVAIGVVGIDGEVEGEVEKQTRRDH